MSDEGLPCRLWVGVAGHRDVQETPELRATVATVLARLEKTVAQSHRDVPLRIGVVTCAAEGADRILAHQLLEQADAALEVVLPMPAHEYSKDFATAASRHEFRELLERADFVLTGPEEADRGAAYVWAAQQLVGRSEALIVVWDGAAARGPGGTGDLVRLAKAMSPGLPIFHIDSVSFQEIAPPNLNSLADRFTPIVQWNSRYLTWLAKERGECLVPTWLPSDVSSGFASFRGYFDLADGDARRYQILFILGTRFLFFGAATATSLAAIQATLHASIQLLRIEIFLLIALVVVAFLLRAKTLQQDWLNNRAIAEWCRGSTYRHLTASKDSATTSRIGDDVSREGRWVSNLCDEIWLARPNPPAIEHLAAVKELCLEWVHGQAHYHRKLARNLRRINKGLGIGIYIAFGATFLAVLIHVGQERHEFDLIRAGVLLFAAVSLPAWGGALAALRASRDYERNAARSDLTASDLRVLAARLEVAADRATVHYLVSAISERLARENRDWLDVMVYHHAELHA